MKVLLLEFVPSNYWNWGLLTMVLLGCMCVSMGFRVVLKWEWYVPETGVLCFAVFVPVV